MANFIQLINVKSVNIFAELKYFTGLVGNGR